MGDPAEAARRRFPKTLAASFARARARSAHSRAARAGDGALAAFGVWLPDARQRPPPRSRLRRRRLGGPLALVSSSSCLSSHSRARTCTRTRTRTRARAHTHLFQACVGRTRLAPPGPLKLPWRARSRTHAGCSGRWPAGQGRLPEREVLGEWPLSNSKKPKTTHHEEKCTLCTVLMRCPPLERRLHSCLALPFFSASASSPRLQPLAVLLPFPAILNPMPHALASHPHPRIPRHNLLLLPRQVLEPGVHVTPHCGTSNTKVWRAQCSKLASGCCQRLQTFVVETFPLLL